MNMLDVVIIVILGFCLGRGIFRGLIKETASIVGVFAGFFAAYSFYAFFSDLLSDWVSNMAYLNIVSFMVIFCGVFFAISLLGIVLKYIVNTATLRWLDRICGCGFGCIKGILIASVLVLVLTTFLPKKAPIVKDSLLSPQVLTVSAKMAKIVPEDMRREFFSKFRDLQETWESL